MKSKICNIRQALYLTGLFFVLSFFNSGEIAAQTPDWAWARGAGGSEGEFAYSVAVDPTGSGESYVAGYFESDSATFGSTTLINSGDIDAFIVKYDAAGNVLWAKGEGGAGPDHAVAVTADPLGSGDIYVAGYFNSPSITLGLTTFINAGNNDLFLVKYDANGNVLWAKSAGGAHDDYAFSITGAADGSDNIYMAGIFYSTTITFGSTTLTNTYAGERDIYIVKYDANGNVLWAKGDGGSWDDNAYSVTADASGNSFVTGNFLSPSITFGLTTLTNTDQYGAATYDMFIVKYDSNGNVLWAKNAAGSDNDYGFSISADASGNTYVTGMFFSPTITFGSTTLTNAGDWNMFIVKYDPAGNVLWEKNAGGTQNVAQSVVADPAGSGGCYAGGYFNSLTTSFDTITLTNSNTNTSSDIFLVKYDGNGNALWAKGADGSSNDQIFSVAADDSGNIYAAGDYSSPTYVFDSTILDWGGFYDMFVAKIGDTTLSPPISAFYSSDTSLCEKFCISFNDQSFNNPVSWQWIFEGGNPSASSDQNPTNICYDNPGTFDVTLITTNANGISDTLILTDYITVNPNPFAPTITQSGNVLTSSPSPSYQWYLDGILIPGATDQNYVITQSGLYTLEISNEDGCKSQSSILAYVLGIDEQNGEFIVNVSGNPSTDQLIIEVTGNSAIEVDLVNILGERLYQRTEKFNSSTGTFSIDITEIPSGIYFLIVHSAVKSNTFKVVKG